MRLNDTVIGAVLLALSLAVLWHTRTFPAIPGQPYGAAVYPRAVGIGLGICSILLIVQGLRSGERLFRIEAGETTGRLWAFAITIGVLFFYLFASDWLGFIISGILMLVALLWAYGVKRSLLLPLAIVATLVIHTAFYKFLKVPLPWGLLEPFAW